MAAITQEQLLAARDRRYRRTPALRVQTPEAARDFVQDVGFCYFWPITGVEMPSLLHAIAGRERAAPMAHDDPDGSKCWGWKDGSLGQRWWYYGKILRRKATLISLDVLPSFYACSENYGDLDDYLEEYRSGRLTLEARQIYEALLHHGPLDTVRLRREARLAAESAKNRFERALVELQVGFKILPTGIAEAGAWHYAFVYDILQRHLPHIPVQARGIKRSEARHTLVGHYLRAVVAAERGMVRRIFHVLNWTPTELQRTIEALIYEGLCREMVVEGLPHPVLVAVDELGK